MKMGILSKGVEDEAQQGRHLSIDAMLLVYLSVLALNTCNNREF